MKEENLINTLLNTWMSFYVAFLHPLLNDRWRKCGGGIFANSLHRFTGWGSMQLTSTTHVEMVILNCDGLATGGGVIRDHAWNFIYGNSIFLGGCSVVVAELKAILLGLKLAWSRDFRRIRVDLDSQVAVQFLTQGCRLQHPCYTIIQAMHP